MNILDDENMLINNTKKLVNISSMLDDLFVMCIGNNVLDTNKVEKLLDRLPYFDKCCWCMRSGSLYLNYINGNNLQSYICKITFGTQFSHSRISQHICIDFPTFSPGSTRYKIQDDLRFLFYVDNNSIWKRLADSYEIYKCTRIL